MNRTLSAAVAATAAASLAIAVPTYAGAAGACTVRWGSLAKAVQNDNHGTLYNVRAGRHECYDRLVLDDSKSTTGYRVSYVTAVRDQGRGAVVQLKGGAFLEVVDQNQATRRIPMPDVSGYPTFRQVAWGGSFEGYTTVGLGVRARLPFRAFRSETHLVIDVAHHW